MKKHIFSLFMGYILLFCPLTGIACASDGYENTLDSLFSSVSQTVEPVFKEERIYNPNTFNYDLDAIDLDPWQTEVPFAPEAFVALNATESIAASEPDFRPETTTTTAQTPLAPTKTPSEKHTCTVADYGHTAAVKSNLTSRMLTHTGERPFKCPEPNCDYAAARQLTLTTHMFVHTGKKPHKCPEPDCDYTATQQSHLKVHMRGHTGEKPYKCTAADCNYAAAQQSTLTRHILTHTDERPFKCTKPDCTYAATQQSHLKSHMLTHTGKKPYKCEKPGCNYTTAYQYHLTGHMRNRHTKANPAKRQRSGIEYDTEPMIETLNPLLLPEQAPENLIFLRTTPSTTGTLPIAS